MKPNTESDSQFDDLLRELARTPEITRVHRKLKPGATLAGRFQIEEQLGRGGMGRVFAAYDKRRAMRVALKMLGSITPESVLQIKNEFRNAAELSHPNLVRLHELYFDGVEWFFSMDLIEGTTLVHAGSLTRARLVHIFQQLALAICELHRTGILHGDLKPSNFLIAQDDKVVLLDFGLARPLADAGRRYARSGTPGYMAPEQETGHPLTAATDWYAFGVVLAEALVPDALAAGRMLRLSALAANEPLAQLALDLCEREPLRRPQSDVVLRALGLEAVPGALPGARTQLELVGRSCELKALRTAFDLAVSSGAPSTLLVQGASGIGKSMLVEQFVREARELGAFVLSGRCRERESIAYKAIDVLIDDLLSRLETLPRAEAAALIPAGIADLTRLFPALRAVDAIARTLLTPQSQDQALTRSRAIAAFTELLANLAARAPLLIWIDDLQWGDAESAALLAPLLARRSGTRVLLVASLRSLGGRICPLLEALFGEAAEIELAPSQVIELQPLSAAESTTLALRLLPDDAASAPLAAAIAQDAAGHPLFLSELARASGTQAGHERPVNLSVLMRRRLADLPEDARALLETMALAGAPLSRTVAHMAKGFAPERVERALDALQSHRLLRSQGLRDDDDLDVLHDRIREIIVMGLPEPTRRSHHLELARALQQQPSTRPDLIATHFEAGGELALAGTYWLQAAERAAQSLAFQHAAQLYRMAITHAQLSSEQRQGLQLREADMLALAGRGADAAELYLAVARGQPRARQLQLQHKAAEQLFHVGHLDRGVEVANQVLRAFGIGPIPQGRALIPALVLGRMRVRARGYAFRARSEAELSSEQLARIDAVWTVASSFGVIDPPRGAAMQTIHVRLALDAGEPTRALRALSLEATYTAGLAGNHARTRHLMDLVEQLARQVDDRSVHGRVAVLRALGDYSDGHVAVARENFELALESFASCYAGGVFFETLTAKRFLIASLFYLGRLAELSRKLPVLLAEAASQGNLYAATTFRTHFGIVAWLTLDDVTEARRQLALARQEWTATNFAVPLTAMFIGETYVSLYTGSLTHAWRRLLEFWPKALASGIMRIRLQRFQLWYLRGACALGAAYDAQQASDAAAASALREQARQSGKRLRRLRSHLAQPLGELLLACVDMGAGKNARARARLLRCIARMDRDGLELFSAVARLRLARLDPAAAPELERHARAVFERERVVDSACIQRMLLPG